jgi:lysine/ornithine N-monooxygenase
MEDQEQKEQTVSPELIQELRSRIKTQHAELTELAASPEILNKMTAFMVTMFMKDFVTKFVEMPDPARKLIVRYVNETHNMVEEIMAKHRSQVTKENLAEALEQVPTDAELKAREKGGNSEPVS